MKLKIAALVAAALAGIYFGLFSCGGYIWHKQVAVAFLVILAAGSLVPAEGRRSGVVLNVVFVLSIPALFVLAQAGAAPFYPSMPESIHEYFQSTLRALEYGPC